MQDDSRDPAATATDTRIGPDHQLPPPKRSGWPAHPGLGHHPARLCRPFLVDPAPALSRPAATAGEEAGAALAGGHRQPHHRHRPGRQHRRLYRCHRHRDPGQYRHHQRPGHRHHHPSRYYKEGQMVHKGQLLIQIDPRPFQATVLQAQGALDRDTNLLAQAQMDLKRYQDAWARNAIPGKPSTTRKKSSSRTRDWSKPTRAPCSMTRCSSASPASDPHHRPRQACAWSTPATWPPPPAPPRWSWSPSCSPSPSSSPSPKTTWHQLQQQMRKGKPLPVDAYDRSEQTKLAPASFGQHRQPDRHHHRHAETARCFR